MKDWKPEPFHIEWQQQLFDTLKDGAVWGIPANRSIWRINKVAKTLNCIHGEQDLMFQQVTAVCTKLGYTTHYTPEQMTPAQVQEQMDAVAFNSEMYGSGKTMTMTEGPMNGKRYVFRPIGPEDLATYRKNLAKLPKHMRWKGKSSPQCDFCTHDTPVVTYAASQLTTGEQQQCWRWLACAACHSAITRNDFKTIERRATAVFGTGMDTRTALFAVKLSLMKFHQYAIPA